jgi:hypothetical protein
MHARGLGGQQAQLHDLKATGLLNSSRESLLAHKKGRVLARVIVTLQRRMHAAMLQRRLVRLVEFDSCLHDCKGNLFLLALITNLFVGSLGLFTMIVCVLLSAAFDAQQAVNWVKAVMQNIALQVRAYSSMRAWDGRRRRRRRRCHRRRHACEGRNGCKCSVA